MRWDVLITYDDYSGLLFEVETDLDREAIIDWLEIAYGVRGDWSECYLELSMPVVGEIKSPNHALIELFEKEYYITSVALGRRGPFTRL